MGILPSTPSRFLTSNLRSAFAKIILISLAAKNRPGHACRPRPKVRCDWFTLTNWFVALAEALRLPSASAARGREKRKGSNLEGSAWRAESWLTPWAEASMLVPAGMTWPLERVKVLRTLRLKEAGRVC